MGNESKFIVHWWNRATGRSCVKAFMFREDAEAFISKLSESEDFLEVVNIDIKLEVIDGN